MWIDIIITAIILWLIWWVTPWPVILIAFSEMLKSPKKWLKRGILFLFIAAITEFFIALFLILSFSFLQIPEFIFHIISLVWVLVLLYIAYQVYKVRKIEYSEDTKQVKAWHIFTLMMLNGPMWVFWLSVCLPEAFKLWNILPYWEFIFLIIFEISMMIWLGLILFSFYWFRKAFTNEKIVGKIFLILSLLLFGIAVKILYTEIIYFIS